MTQLSLGTKLRDSMHAVLSGCETYRYALYRTVDPANESTLAWCMLNPSTADAANDDPTIRKVKGFTKRLGYGRLVVVNAYSFRATKPKDLLAAQRRGEDIFGPRNDVYLRGAAGIADCCIVAWGAHLKDEAHARRVVELLREGGTKLYCLARTNGGQPRHPLMLPYSHKPEPFELATARETQ
ncbi:MAG: DUF1643 domain-containing protein [Gammaproteobacteria bacterium]|nr:DUF1643 domain-containing protein [Gammaproteobacteria bacterium]